MRTTWKVLAAALAALGAGMPAQASEELLLRLLGPPARGSEARVSYAAQWRPERRAEGAAHGGAVEVLTQRAALLSAAPLGAEAEGSVALGLRHHGLRGEARLPKANVPLPDHLWDPTLGAAYRRFLALGRWTGLAAVVNSPSDRPFHSAREVSVSATALYRAPRGERAAWLFFLRYDNTREFWNHIPLPGLAYWARPTPRSMVVLGVPYSSVRWAGESGWGASLSYALLRTLGAEANYRFSGALQAYAGFHMDSESHFRARRDHREDRLWYYEKRVQAGVRLDPSPRWSLELAGGHAFDRYYFEGKDFEDRTRDRVPVADGPFLRAGGSLRF
ncbi:MAG: hypothetical protein AB1578_06990 [Thermodesulfobacteriota bacterium]